MHLQKPLTLALSDLLGTLFSQEEEFVPDPARQIAGLTMILNSPDTGCILVAKMGGEIVGMVTLLFVTSSALGQPAALLEDVIVREEYRAQKIGSQLITAAIAQCRAQGCGRITLLTDSDNETAHRFYARFGFARSAMVPFRLLL